jgi:serine/threonine protein kinase
MVDNFNNSNNDYEEEDSPMALVVEDEHVSQNFICTLLNGKKIKCETAIDVDEALAIIKKHPKDYFDMAFVDIWLKNGQLGTDLLKTIRKENLMKKTLIIVMSGGGDEDLIRECYDYNIQNYVIKPLDKIRFTNIYMTIQKHLEKMKCPLPKYKIEDHIGDGSTGSVDLVKEKKTGKYYAMKTVNIDPNDIRRKKEEDEVKFYMGLKLPTILELKDYKIEENKLYIILEYAEHGTLSSFIKESTAKLSKEQILDWCVQLFVGLYIIHSRNLMHRDIKTDNLFICKNQVLKIGDFGIAKATEKGLANTLCGTPYYMAPEVFKMKEYNDKVDIWAAGVVMYEMIMREKPYDGQTNDEIKKKVLANSYKKIPDTVDPELRILIEKTLRANSNERYSAADILRLDFMKERLMKLKETLNFPECLIEEIEQKGLGIENKDEKQKELKQFFNNLKLAIQIDSYAIKSKYKARFFSQEREVIRGSDLELLLSENKDITIESINKLLELKFMFNILKTDEVEFDSSDNAYYQIKFLEEENTDNSLVSLSLKGKQEVDNPVELSINCLNKAEKAWNYICENCEQKDKAEIISSQEFLDFLFTIRQLRFLKMETYTKQQKLAIILNIYQTMFIHFLIKSNLAEESDQSRGLIHSVRCLFTKTDRVNVNVIYEIGGQKLSLAEMKHIVIRRNKKPPQYYLFRMVSSSDPRINFIEENDNYKLLIVCTDPPCLSDMENYFIDYTRFKDTSVYDQIDEHCKTYVAENIRKEQNQLYIPKCFKDYIRDFGSDELDLVKNLTKLNTEMKTTSLLKSIKEKQLSICYY